MTDRFDEMAREFKEEYARQTAGGMLTDEARPLRIAFSWPFEQVLAARLRAIHDEVVEECALIADDHCQFCATEAHSGGDTVLYERANGAAYLASRFRTLKTGGDND